MSGFCVKCGTELPDKAEFCPKCGTKVEIPRCPACGKEVDFDADFCIHCGQPLMYRKTINTPVSSEESSKLAVEQRPVIHAGPSTGLTHDQTESSMEMGYEDDIKQIRWSFKRFWGYNYVTKNNQVTVSNRTLYIQSQILERTLVFLTHRSETEEEVPLANITNLALQARVSAINWLLITFFISLVPIGFLLHRTPVAPWESLVLVCTLAVAFLVWYTWFSLHNYRMTITAQDNKKTYLFAKKADDLRVLYDELSARTGIEGERISRVGWKILISVLLGVTASATIWMTLPAASPSDTPVVSAGVTIEENKSDTDSHPVPTPEYGYWCYDPSDMIPAEVEAKIISQNAIWNETYGSITAVAAIEDSLESANVEEFSLQLWNNWGLWSEDMLLLIYNNGASCHWIYPQIMEETFGADALSDLLDTEFEADPGDNSGDSALLNFFEAIGQCYSVIYDSDSLPIAEPLYLMLSSGAGAWGSNLTLYSDGSFEGSSYDSDMGDWGEDYPNGTMYLCFFSGHFTDMTQINDYTYSMTLREAVSNDTESQLWIEDGIRYIASEPYGLENGNTFYLYTPDAPVGKLPSEFLDWWWPWQIAEDGYASEILSCYGLYNEETGYGFFTN